jgi:hypothetical protein
MSAFTKNEVRFRGNRRRVNIFFFSHSNTSSPELKSMLN